MQTSEKSRLARGKKPWRSSGSEASTEMPPQLAPPPPAPPQPTSPLLLQKTEKRRELGLRRLWSAVRSASGAGGEAADPPDDAPAPACSLPLLQVWPSQDSPRAESDRQSFAFPGTAPRSPADLRFHNDSGIDSIQASPSPASCAAPPSPPGRWRAAGSLLHPDHARAPPPPVLSASSSAASSLGSVAARTSEAGLRDDRRRSSTMTTRYSLFDALDLEYALLRAAARGSVGPYSLSESLHKLTFTQSLAFPALARGLQGKRRRSAQAQTQPMHRGEPGLNAFAKVITTLVLVLVSVLVFCVVYKFVRT